MTTDRPILFLDHTAKLGGAELSIARYLRSDSALPSVLGILSPESVAPWNLPNDVPVRHTHSTAGVDSIRSVVSELRRLVDEVNPSCVIANSFSAAQYLAFVPKCGRKYFYFLRQEALPEGLGRIKSALNRVFVLRRFDGYFANSRWTASTLPPGISATRPVVICHPVSGIDVAPRPRIRGKAQPLRLLTLSRLSPWKGVDTALDAVRLVDATSEGVVSMTVAGGDLFGEEGHSEHLRRIAEGHAVRFVGHQPDTAPLLQEADVLLCLSKTPEPFGQVIAQGMANGCVVIATNHGGPCEIITDGVDGILVPPDSADAVRDVLVRLQREPDLFASISANALRAARAYTDDKTIPGFTGGIETLIERSR